MTETPRLGRSQFMGDFPLWLAPVQARVLPISEKFAEYAHKVERELVNAGVRCDIDESNEKRTNRVSQNYARIILPVLA